MKISRLLILKYSIFILLLLNNNNNVNSYIGINWGRQASQRIIPSMVIDLILQNGIPEVKIFSASPNVVQSFIGTDIGLTIAIPNDVLKIINVPEDAEKYMNSRLKDYLDKGIKLRYLSIGTQPFSKANFNKTYGHAVDVIELMQGAIDKIYPNRGIKATIDHYTDVMNNALKPSEAEFNEDVKDLMVRSTQALARIGAPIWIDMFPIYSAKSLFNDIEFAFFNNNATETHFIDEGYEYTNIFEVVYDKFVCALEKEGFGDMKIIVGQIGWPTDGINGGSIENAERYHKGLIKHILSGKGTPRRPGPIDAFLHNLADENTLPIITGGERGGFIRHWGIYKFDGKPKYNIDFSGQGRDIKPVSAKGVTHFPKRWCVFNNQTNDANLLETLVAKACNVSDCTNMEKGGSCDHLGYPLNVSYAFNMFFQSKKQKISQEGCDFQGFGVITPIDPSTKNCNFPVEIISAEFIVDYNHGNMIMIMKTYVVMGIFSVLFLFFFA